MASLKTLLEILVIYTWSLDEYCNVLCNLEKEKIVHTALQRRVIIHIKLLGVIIRVPTHL